MSEAELAQMLGNNPDLGVVDNWGMAENPKRKSLSIEEIQVIKEDVHGPDCWLEVLEGERPTSWNKFYSGRHWNERNREAKRVHALVHDAFARCGLFKRRVDITIVAYFDSHPLDPCNIPAKIYIDGLLGHVITDDSRKFVRCVSTRSEVDKEHPRVKIEVHTI